MKTMTVLQVRNVRTAADCRDGINKGQYAYRVIQVIDSIEPPIGQFIQADALQLNFCDSKDWKVIIKGK